MAFKKKFYYLSYTVTIPQPSEGVEEDDKGAKKVLVSGNAVTNVHPLIWITQQAKRVQIEPWDLGYWAEIPKDIYELFKEQLGKLED
ncbi:MAG: hypothetical protein V3U75_13160 [Methylococcaceae bacterium]